MSALHGQRVLGYKLFDTACESWCLQVSLHRADALSSVLELDKHMNITHADEAAGLIFSVNPKKLVNQSFLT